MVETWNECVIIQLPALDGVQIVWTPAQAANLLSDCWPVDHGVAYSEALNKCTDAMLGVYPWETAREAFIKAILEGRVTKLR
ncbi:DUF982 domain-containing protein [Ensifer sp. ENS07]|uniref:DUF982 domain-containing protein n=1 Tax=Ensifer sp. ENS07 TaxID=2769274 RepID=UPI000723B74C|nr:DUF982 domain-containing protein [Ensifer sp. ENS07]KSV78179.1 hypothetical protein N182_21085 [Sinorhizobium sp. GL2]MBD9639002.1 DUF982 domain-containing protein [Ensifer sp. ENS07]